jgi:thiol-disulfide isomerase/thioredoxin
MNNKRTIPQNQVFLFLIFLFSLILPSVVCGQVKAIVVGDKVPNIEIKKIINYKASHASLSDFKGKLLILDFWGTYCAPCITMFPKTDSLAKLFNNKVQFLSVTKEQEGKVKVFLSNMFNVRKIKPVSVVEDTLLSSYFRYSEIPYYVWINADGEVIGTTGASDITEQNVRAALTGKPTTFVNRNDLRWRQIDWEKSLFALSHNYTLIDTLTKREEIPNEDIISYSIAGKYVEHTPGQMWFDQNHFGAYNIATEFLYRWYYDIGYYKSPVPGAFDPLSNHVFEITDKKLLNKISIPPGSIKGGTKEMHDWGVSNGISYEIVFPKNATWREKMEMIKQDLYRYFEKPLGFEVHVEKRIDSNATVLRRTDDLINLATTGGKAEEHHDMFTYSQVNMPISRLLSILNSYFFQIRNTSFIDKSGLTKNVDLELNCEMTSLISLNKSLEKYGLRFSVEPTEIDVLVFSDAKK